VLVVDSGFVGVRKPDPPIYHLTVARLSGISAEECLFVDDVQVNVDTARAIGMIGVHFRSNEQAIGEIRHALALDAGGGAAVAEAE
jgi:putative hydrolase of the HAD superfamily